MNQDGVDFLDERGLGRGNGNSHVREKSKPGWLAPGQRDDRYATVTSLAGGSDDVGRLPTGTDSHQHIPVVTKRSHLSREDSLIAIVVGDRGQDRRVRRAAAIPADHDKMAGAESLGDDRGRATDLMAVGSEKRERRAQCSGSVK